MIPRCAWLPHMPYDTINHPKIKTSSSSFDVGLFDWFGLVCGRPSPHYGTTVTISADGAESESDGRIGGREGEDWHSILYLSASNSLQRAISAVWISGLILQIDWRAKQNKSTSCLVHVYYVASLSNLTGKIISFGEAVRVCVCWYPHSYPKINCKEKPFKQINGKEYKRTVAFGDDQLTTGT